MIRKKNKFFTFIFSTLFGAGHMYMGFMKQGVSIMSLAASIVAVGYIFRMEVFLLILPILWFYSFFDSINKMSMPDMLFKQQEDHFILLDMKDNRIIIEYIKKHDYAVAVGLIALGGILIADNSIDFLISRLDGGVIREVLNNLRWDAPRLLFAVFIIFIGVKMIQGKKKELEKEEKAEFEVINDSPDVTIEEEKDENP